VADLRRPDDEVLIAGALRGDEEALGRLLARDQEWAYNVAYRVLGQDADARDAVQDAFLQTVRALRGEGSPPRSIESYRPWLRRVVSNAAITQIRRRPLVSANVLDRAIPHDGQAEPGRSIEREETRAQVLQALLALPATQRVALALRELLDMPYDEIADALDLPRTAVGTLLFRARAAFRAAYDRAPEVAPPPGCPDLLPLFSSIVDDEPRPAAWQELEEHLRGCERCRSDLEGQRRARRLYGLIPLLALPAGWEPVAAALQGLAGDAATGSVSGGGSAAAADSGVASAGGPAAASADGGASGAVAGQSASAAGQPAAAATGAAELAGSSGAVTSAAGGAASSTSGGLFAGGLLAGGVGAKVALATVATAAIVGVAVVAGPLAGPGADTAAGASPSPAAGAPAASPGLASAPGATSIVGPALTGATAPETTAGLVAPGATPAAGLGGTPSASPAVVTSPSPGPATAPLAAPSVETDAPLTSPAGSPTTATPPATP
jgi:RNA polymerase sigma-70 factor, ECF subfamily